MTGKWISAVDCSPPPFTPETSGWVLENEMYTIKWFDSAISPESIEVICCNENNDNDDDNTDEFSDYNLEEEEDDDDRYSESED